MLLALQSCSTESQACHAVAGGSRGSQAVVARAGFPQLPAAAGSCRRTAPEWPGTCAGATGRGALSLFPAQGQSRQLRHQPAHLLRSSEAYAGAASFPPLALLIPPPLLYPPVHACLADGELESPTHSSCILLAGMGCTRLLSASEASSHCLLVEGNVQGGVLIPQPVCSAFSPLKHAAEHMHSHTHAQFSYHMLFHIRSVQMCSTRQDECTHTA